MVHDTSRSAWLGDVRRHRARRHSRLRAVAWWSMARRDDRGSTPAPHRHRPRLRVPARCRLARRSRSTGPRRSSGSCAIRAPSAAGVAGASTAEFAADPGPARSPRRWSSRRGSAVPARAGVGEESPI